jgi:hypothetical protein
MGSEGNKSDRVDRAAIYRELHRDYLDQFNATRQIEWQLTYQPNVETRNRKPLRSHPLGE